MVAQYMRQLMLKTMLTLLVTGIHLSTCHQYCRKNQSVTFYNTSKFCIIYVAQYWFLHSYASYGMNTADKESIPHKRRSPTRNKIVISNLETSFLTWHIHISISYVMSVHTKHTTTLTFLQFSHSARIFPSALTNVTSHENL
jgi:hypothetical protein